VNTHKPCKCISDHENLPAGGSAKTLHDDDPWIRWYSCGCGRLWIRILFEGYHTNSATFYAAHVEQAAIDNFNLDQIDDIFLASDKIFIGGYDTGDRIEAYNGGFPVDPWYGFRREERLQKARDFAILAHGNQKYGDHPYEYHLTSVHEVMMRHPVARTNLLTLMAGWLHDVLEDTEVSKAELEKNFGERVTDTVYRVSDEPGADRKERKQKTYPKIRGHIPATVVKLCDRIANVEASREVPRKHDMYQQEHSDFKRELCVKEHTFLDDLWGELDQLLSRP
jgi:hypothetical protein